AGAGGRRRRGRGDGRGRDDPAGGRAVSGGPALAPRPELITDSVESEGPRWVALATSTDHKDIGRIYVTAALSFLVLGLVEFLLIRLQLAIPENDLIEPVTFNRLLSVMSPTLVVLFVLPLAIGLFTYVVPLQIGARSLAFPRLANFALWLYLLGGALLYVSFVYTPPEAGFNALPPLSDIAFISNNGVDVWITSVGLSVLGFTLQAINLIVTIFRLRAPGLVWRRLPPFSFAAFSSSAVLLVVGPAMLAALTMLEIDRHFNGVFFDPGEGGAPTYYQHLSWIFFSGCYLLMILPAAGAISEILPALARKPLLSRGAVAGSMAAIAGLGLLAWMQNMFTGAIPIGWLYLAMAAALLLIVPIGLLFANWLATLAFGSIELRAPMLFALGAISTLSIGLAGELLHAVIPVNWLLADTVDATAMTGYVLVGGSVLGGLAGLYYWFPKMTGRTAGESMARWSLALIILGAHLTFAPMFLAGLEGQPVDVFKYFEGQGLDTYNLLTTIGAFVLVLGITLSLVNLLLSLSHGPRAGPDPWRGDSLEWFATSPPPPHNFDVVPDVRSDEPMRDIRDAVKRLETRGTTRKAESGEPVA
ncbi:MAG: cbb3-type cytochrome c oxidase subunit I, partial [Actinomycetota bacterium]|nr:cbb3-type cytochrome c oxidase subunit I [Actinomycetota bacterium]